MTPGSRLRATVTSIALGLASTEVATAAPDVVTVPLVRGLNVVINFSYMTNSPDLVLSLERIDDEGYKWLSVSKISAADAQQGKADYGGSDTELRNDLAASHHIFTRFFADEDEHVGGTVLMASAEVFSELTTKGTTNIDVVDIPGEKGMTFSPGVTYERKNFRGSLNKVGIETQRIIVDGEPALVSVLHARGTLKARDLTRDYEFWWANDRNSRLLMRYKSEDYVEFRVVRIDNPATDSSGPAMSRFEAALSGSGTGGGGGDELKAEGNDSSGKLKKRDVLPPDDEPTGAGDTKICRAPANGLYFATGSAEILAPSRPALERVAALLKKHPDWTVTIEGHTDNVGSDDSNLLLSRNRAAAVKTALTTQFAIDASRLKTEGYGRKRPIDTNDTPDGRAHNRRVEIARNCR